VAWRVSMRAPESASSPTRRVELLWDKGADDTILTLVPDRRAGCPSMANQLVTQNLLYSEVDVTELSPRGESRTPSMDSIVRAIIQTKSRRRPHAVGKAGEIGLMQI